MIGTDVLVAGAALGLTVAVGLVAHECVHALTLRLASIDHTIEYFPNRTDSVLATLAKSPWANVTPRPTGEEPPWQLRTAAMMPVALAAPVLALGIAGHLPTDNLIASAVIIGWLACTVPSPQDFSVAFYAHRILEREREHDGEPESDLTDSALDRVSTAD